MTRVTKALRASPCVTLSLETVSKPLCTYFSPNRYRVTARVQPESGATGKTRTIIAQDGQPISTKLEKGFVWLESETFVARVPLTPFIAALLAAKIQRGAKA